MKEQTIHDMIVPPTRDEAARQDFAYSFRSYVLSDVRSGDRKVYDAAVLPELRRSLGREPENRRDVAPAMQRNPYWQMSSSLLRLSQEVMWDVYGEKILSADAQTQNGRSR